jgi:hypothetical protein
MTKFLIVFVLLLIIASLAVGLRHLLTEGERSPKTVKALTVRIGLSIALFFLLLLGYQAGLLHPHGLKPGANPAAGAGGQK